MFIETKRIYENGKKLLDIYSRIYFMASRDLELESYVLFPPVFRF